MIDKTDKKSNRFHTVTFFLASFFLFVYQLDTRPIFDDFVTFLWYDSAIKQTIGHLLNPRSGYFWIRPLAIFIGYVEYLLFGVFIPGYRCVSIGFHAANALLVSRIARHNLNMPPGTAIAAGWLFLLHPAAVQSVCYITGQVEVIYLFFMLSAFHMLFNFYQGDGTRKSLVSGSVCFCLALLSKETAFALIPIIIGVACIWGAKKQLLRQGIMLISTLSGIGGIYLIGRYALYSGVGGYGLNLLQNMSVSAIINGPIKKLLIDYPAAHFFPLPPDILKISHVFPIGTVIITLVLISLAFKQRSSLQNYFIALWILLVSLVILVLVVPYLEADILPPRYYYLGSVAVAFALAPLFYGKYSCKLPVVIVICCLWIVGQWGFQRDFRRAGTVTEYILSTLDHYCFHLKAGGRIDVYNIPDRIGAIDINIPDKRDNVFNLQAHRRCHLAPLMDLSRGQRREYWTEYMNLLPGQVGVYRNSEPVIPTRPGTLVFIMDIEEAFQSR